MKTLRILFLIILFLAIKHNISFAQNVNYSGDWKLNKDKTESAGTNQYSLSSLKINLKKDSLLTTRVYVNANEEEYSFVENLSLNGKESNITVFGMPRTSKAFISKKDGLLHVESTTVVNAEKHSTKEVWQIEKDGNTLTVFLNTIIPGIEDKFSKKYFEKAN